jgi:hypothetical protein
VVSTERHIGEYRILDRVGHGGMATVFKAVHPACSFTVAIKVLFPVLAQDENFKARFERELRVLLQLQHPNIVPVLDFGPYENTAYIVVPYYESGTLEDRLTGGSLTPREGARLMDQVSSALELAHQAGIVHRDVKPSNILLDQGGNALLSDFGLAHLVDTSLSLTGSAVIGTPAYMSPEQCRGEKVDARSDQYSLGVILYQLCTGQLPYKGDTPLAVVIQHVNEPLPHPRQVNPKLPREVEDVLLKALSKDPKERYASVAAFNAAFQRALAEALNGRQGAGAKLRRWIRRSWRLRRASRGQSERKGGSRSMLWLAALAALLLLACPITAKDLSSMVVGVAGARQGEVRPGAIGEPLGGLQAPLAAAAPQEIGGGRAGARGDMASGTGSVDAPEWSRPTSTEAPPAQSSSPTTEGPASQTPRGETTQVPSQTTNSEEATPAAPTNPPASSASPISTFTPSITASATATTTASPTPSVSPEPSASTMPTSTATGTRAATAISTQTSAACSIGELMTWNGWAGWEIRNNGDLRMRIERIFIRWPWHSGAMERIGLGRDMPADNTIWEGPASPPSATIHSNWVTGADLDVPAGQSRILSFEFANQAANGNYILEVTFHNQCVVRAQD